MKKQSKFIIPSIFAGLLITLYYSIKFFTESINISDLIISIILDVVLSFLFGFIILGILGWLVSRMFFNIHGLLTKKKKLEKQYVVLNTGYNVTSKVMIKRAFLLYCISISLALTTIQAAGFLGYFPSVPPANGDPSTYIITFELWYTVLVFLFAFLLTFLLPPIWYFDDLNVMYWSIEEGVKFLNPFGRSVLPSLAGYGGPTIVISYTIFIINRVGTSVPLLLLLDPLITLYIPIIFLIGYETISFIGKRNLKIWLAKKGIKIYDKLEYKLMKNKVDGPDDTMIEKVEPIESNNDTDQS
ncbi:MAG: hypothetical protein ACTSRA_22975 [Promethearchaeota archaeon]